MEETSISLCNLSGSAALDALILKVHNPRTLLNLGNHAIAGVLGVDHHNDGLPVVRLVTDKRKELTVQFEPSDEGFSITAIDEDGNLVC